MTDSHKLFPSGIWCLEESVGYLLARSRTKLAKAIDAELTVQHDITHAQGSVLMMLSTGRYATAADLVRDLFIDSASMTRMLDRLEKRALIVRVPSATDRRVFNLQLSETGTTLAGQLRPLYNDVLNRYFADFTQEEVNTLKHLLRKLLGSDLEPVTEDAGKPSKGRKAS